MEMIHFQGLHCYHDCIISIANHHGIRYPLAFATLWSETDFRYDPHRKVYLTKRLITSLASLGAKVQRFDCFTPKDTGDVTSMIRDGEFIVVGMDAYHIPWNQSFRVFHGPHYFIVKKARTEKLLCVDPTYGIGEVYIDRATVEAHVFDISRVTIVPENPCPHSVVDEAQGVLQNHPTARSALEQSIRSCANGDPENAHLLAAYMDSMLRNRYLFRHYLNGLSLPKGRMRLFFSPEFFAGWTAVKNGLYKAVISAKRESVLDAVRDRFCGLMDQEIDMAAVILDSTDCQFA